MNQISQERVEDVKELSGGGAARVQIDTWVSSAVVRYF
jgi:hypothetical protein